MSILLKSDAKSGNSIRITYLGNITLNKHIRQNNLNEVFRYSRHFEE